MGPHFNDLLLVTVCKQYVQSLVRVMQEHDPIASSAHELQLLCIGTTPQTQLRTIAIIAEGIPENCTKILIKRANERGVAVIGPATVGGIKSGCFKIGNTGGMTDNILTSKLYRPGRYEQSAGVRFWG